MDAKPGKLLPILRAHVNSSRKHHGRSETKSNSQLKTMEDHKLVTNRSVG